MDSRARSPPRQAVTKRLVDDPRDWSPPRYRIPRRSPSPGPYPPRDRRRSPSPDYHKQPSIHWPSSNYSPSYTERHRGHYDPTWDVNRQFYARTLDEKRQDEEEAERARLRRLALRTRAAEEEALLARQLRHDARDRADAKAAAAKAEQAAMTPRKRAAASSSAIALSPSSTSGPAPKAARGSPLQSTSTPVVLTPSSTPVASPLSRSRATSPLQKDGSPRASSRDSSPDLVVYDTGPDSEPEPAEDGGAMSYGVRIDTIRSTWAEKQDMSPPFEEAPEEDFLLGSHGPRTQPKPILPWHRQHGVAVRRHQAVLTGTAQPNRGPLDSKAFLHKPKFPDAPYRIIGVQSVDAVRVPDSFSGGRAGTTSRLPRRTTALIWTCRSP